MTIPIMPTITRNGRPIDKGSTSSLVGDECPAGEVALAVPIESRFENIELRLDNLTRDLSTVLRSIRSSTSRPTSRGALQLHCLIDAPEKGVRISDIVAHAMSSGLVNGGSTASQSYRSVQSTLAYNKKKGFVCRKAWGRWCLTAVGRAMLE